MGCRTLRSVTAGCVRGVASAAVLLACVCRGAVAQVDDGNERARIAAQRVQAQARFDAQAAECRRRFVVTACLNDAQRERREALDGLRRQQLLLDDAQRRQRAEDRIEAIRGKQAATADPAASSSRPARLPAKPPPTTMRLRQSGRERAPAAADHAASAAVDDGQPRAPVAPAPTGKPRDDRAGRSSRNDAASEQARLKRQQDQQARQADMAAHRQAVERRNAERAASGRKPAAPLPVPADARQPAAPAPAPAPMPLPASGGAAR